MIVNLFCKAADTVTAHLDLTAIGIIDLHLEVGDFRRMHRQQLIRTDAEAAVALVSEQCGKPVFLAGGLNAGNVREAIETVQPFGVDVCSGVRTEGKLDRTKLQDFFAAIQKI